MATTSSRPTIGVALLALLALLDISWGIQVPLGLVDSADAPPTPVMGLFALIGVVILTTARPALRGNRTAAWVMVAFSVVAAGFADLPALFLDAPGWVQAVTGVAVALTVVGIWATVPLLRGAGAERRIARSAA